MTTVFASAIDGVMVSDSRCTSDSQWFPMTKVHRIGKELVGIAGTIKDASTWLEWYSGGKKGARPKLEGYTAIILRADGVFEVAGDSFEQRIERGFHGIGSGGGYAVAASMAGADPEKAVRIACDIDANSGGDVVVHTLKP